MKYILVCSCFNMGKRASEAFTTIFPNEVLPEIIKGKDKIFKIASELKNEHIKAISKLSGRFAYYVNLDGDKIIEEYDLIKGRRVA